MGAMIGSNGVNGVIGLSANTFMQFCTYFSEFNQSFVWPNYGDATLFGSKRNGTYTGVLGQIVANEGDVFLLPMPVSPIAEGVIEVGPALMSSGTAIVTVPQVRDDGEDEILNQLFHFKTEIVILLVVAVYCFAQIISMSEDQINSATKPIEKFLEGLWKVSEIMLLQANLDPVSVAGKALFLLTMIGVMFWYILWGNEMKSDMSTYDTSGIVKDIDDLIKSNLSIKLSKEDPSESLMAAKARMDPESKVAKLYGKVNFIMGGDKDSSYRKNVEEFTMDQMEMVKPDNLKKSAYISTREILQLFRSIACLAVQEVSFLIITELDFDTPFSPWLNPRYPKEWKDMLYRKFVTIREGGLVHYIWNEISKDSMEVDMLKEMKRNMPEKNATRQCIFFNVASYMDSLEHSDFTQLAVRHFKGAFILLCGCCTVALLVLILEKCATIASAAKKYRNKLRKKSRKVDVDNSDSTLGGEGDPTLAGEGQVLGGTGGQIASVVILSDIQEVIEESTGQFIDESEQNRIVKEEESRRPLQMQVTTLVEVHANEPMIITSLE